MGFSHDGLPYIGRRSDGIYVNAGFTGHGNPWLRGALVEMAHGVTRSRS
jgi:hypothetical protein